MPSAELAVIAPQPVSPVSALDRTRRRWQIRLEQIKDGDDPCFASDRRYCGQEESCRWSRECRALRAEWRR